MFKRTTDCVRDSTETLPKLPSTSPCELYGVFPISSLAYVFYYETIFEYNIQLIMKPKLVSNDVCSSKSSRCGVIQLNVLTLKL